MMDSFLSYEQLMVDGVNGQHLVHVIKNVVTGLPHVLEYVTIHYLQVVADNAMVNTHKDNGVEKDHVVSSSIYS